jgi:tetratricopeptide (TPR) repeat protein
MWGNALKNYEQSLYISKDIGNKEGMASALNNIGGAYGTLGQRQKALHYLKQALPIHQEIGDLDGEMRTRWWLGGLYQEEGQLQEGRKELVKAIEIAKYLESPALMQIEQTLAKTEAKLAKSQGQL